MIEAHRLGMTSGDYVFITTTLRLVHDLEQYWGNITATKNIPTEAFWPFIQVWEDEQAVTRRFSQTNDE